MKFKQNNSAVAVVLLLGAVLSLLVFVEIRRGALDRFSLVFKHLANAHVLAISQDVDLHRHELEGLQRFYEQSTEVTEQEFTLYTEPMLEHPCVQTLKWIPLVRQHERKAFEERTGIQIKDQDAGGQLVPAQERAEYFPIALATPFKLNEAALGFDLGSNPARWAALGKARDQGEGIRMELVRLVESPTSPAVFMAVVPVYRQPSKTLEERRRNLKGFVLGMYRIDGLVKCTMAQLPDQGLAFLLEDLDAPPGNRLLYRHDPRVGTFDWTSMQEVPLSHEALIDKAGRTWRMTVLPNDAFVKTHLFRVYWWILPAGLLFTLLVALLLRMQLLGRLRAELLVQERTTELRASEEEFRSLFESSLDAIMTLEPPSWRFTSGNPATVKMFGAKNKEEFISREPWELSPERQPDGRASAEKAREMIETAIREGSHLFEWTHRRIDGKEFPADVLLARTERAGKLLLQATVRDITKRKQAEEAMTQERQLMNALMNNSPDRIYFKDIEGRFLRVNRAVADLFGADDPEEVVGKTDFDFHPKKHAQKTQASDAELLRTGNSIIAEEAHRIRPDKRDEWVSSTKLPLRDSTGRIIGMFGISRDVTKYRKAVEALQESERRFRTYFEQGLIGMLITSVEKGFIEVNESVCDLFGYSHEEFSKRTWVELTHPEDLESDLAQFNQLLAGEIVGYTLEKRFFRKDGGIIHTVISVNAMRNSDGSVNCILILLDDITDRKRVEEEKDRLLAAINQAAESIVITDIDGRIEYVNPAFEVVTGYTAEEAIGKNPRILKSGEHAAAFYKKLWGTLLRGETWRGQFINRKKDGTFYTEEATISPVKNSVGKVINYVAIKADITIELIREEQFRQSQKMESVGQLAGGIAHDFNNILQTITGFSGLILGELDSQSALRPDVLEIQKAARHAGDLTQQLLAFSRKQPAEQTQADLNVVLSEGQKMFGQTLDESFQLQVLPNTQLMPVAVDATQILQVAMNLIVNARDAMPDGGIITLRMQNREIQEKDLSGWANARVGQWVCFSVSDTGCGMDEKQMGHIFDPFYTTKAVGKGTGLGLSVVYGIVKEHGGWIAVSSTLGSGSVFEVFLPANEPQGGDGSLDFDAFLGKRILLVEDDEVIRGLTSEILQDVGYAVLPAADIQEAEKIFAEKKEELDLLFSDVVLPDGNGVELAESCLEQRPELPVLLFSGASAEQAGEDRIKEKGFNYMRKPFNLKKLLKMVEMTITNRNR